VSEETEYIDLLAKARKISADLKITLAEALLLICAHEVVCTHFHIDQGFILGAITRVEGQRKE